MYSELVIDYVYDSINRFRDPSWGRGLETPGEDPFVTSEYAAAFVSGFQGNDDKYLRASACCKHFACVCVFSIFVLFFYCYGYFMFCVCVCICCTYCTYDATGGTVWRTRMA